MNFIGADIPRRNCFTKSIYFLSEFESRFVEELNGCDDQRKTQTTDEDVEDAGDITQRKRAL